MGQFKSISRAAMTGKGYPPQYVYLRTHQAFVEGALTTFI